MYQDINKIFGSGARIQIIMLSPKPLMRAEPLAFLPVRPEAPTPLAANLLVSHDPVQS